MNAIVKHISLMAVLLLLAGCTSTYNNDEPDNGGGHYNILFCNSNSVIHWESSAVQGRAVVQSPPVTMLDIVGVYGYSDSDRMPTVFSNAPMLCPTGETYQSVANTMPWDYPERTWPYEPTKPWIKDANYKFYVYSPYLADNELASATGTNYDAFDTFTFNEVSDFSADDYMVSSLLKHYSNSGTLRNQIQVVELQHLQSRLRFCYKLGTKYSQLRSIKVTGMAVLSSGKTWNVTIHHDADGVPSNPVWTMNSESVSAPAVNVNLNNDPTVPDDGLELRVAEANVLASAYVYPGANSDINGKFPGITVTVYYDVYDLEWTCTRRNQSISNYVALGWKLQAGKYYDVHITVEPDYLYVLSDHDPNSDGYIIIPDE